MQTKHSPSIVKKQQKSKPLNQLESDLSLLSEKKVNIPAINIFTTLTEM